MAAAIQRDITRPATAAIRVAIVDDSVVVRGLLSRWLSETPGIQVVGTFRSGREIIDALPALHPRIVLLDLDMPDMDGITALPLILASSPDARVIVVSSLSVHGAELTIRSLMRGATDYLPKPSNHREFSTSVDFRQALIAKVMAVGAIRALTPQHPFGRTSQPAPRPAVPPPDSPATPVAPRMPPWINPARSGLPAPSVITAPVAAARAAPVPGSGLRGIQRTRPRLVVIGASTGGPQALVALLSKMRKCIPHVPIIIAQHMPPVFGSIFASHLKQHAGLPVIEAVEGNPLVPGTIHLAPGGCHTVARRRADGQYQIALLPSEARGPWRPSIDLLFSSAAETFGSDALAIALTGMGRDGTEGAGHLVKKGANVIVQDEASSIVWGIPGSIMEAGFACALLSPEKLGDLASSLIEGHAQ